MMVNWLLFTKFMSEIGDSMKFFGHSILSLITVVSIIFFWFIVFTFYQPYQEIAFLMLRFLRAGLGMFIIGFLFHYLFHFINELIHKKQMKRIELNIKGKK